MGNENFELWEKAKNELTQDSQFKNEAAMVFTAIKKTIEELQRKTLTEEQVEEIKKDVENRLVEIYGAVPQRIEIKDVDGKIREIKGVTHEIFEEAVKYVAKNVPLFIVGPAGCGKNVLAKQIADALGLDYYYTNAVTQEHQVKGFANVRGLYVPTAFFDAFTKGGLMLFDEIDASIPEVLTILNMAIANKCFDFPAPIRNIEANPNFRVIAAGNTVGEGANSAYSARNKLDAASLDRFALIKMDYSPKIEEAIANGDQELIDYLRAVRKAVKDAGLEVIVSYRAFERFVAVEGDIGTVKTVKQNLIKGLSRDDVKIIIGEIEKVRGMRDNRFYKATVEIEKTMEE